MLQKKQLQFLKKEAHHIKPIFQVGKGGVNDDMIKQIGQAVDKRELIKIALLQNAIETPEEVARVIKEQLPVEIVQIIGHTIVLYQESSTEKYRRLSAIVKKVK